METLGLVAAAGVGYLLGAVPVGYLVGRVVRGTDIRQAGSGRIGTTNALRTLGPAGAAAVLLLDLGKGLAAAVLGAALARAANADLDAWGGAFGGLAAVIGHIWSIFVGFRGGRGVASLVASVLVVLRLAHPAVLVFMAGVALAILLAHADNIERLRTGTERRLGERAAGPEEAGRA